MTKTRIAKSLGFATKLLAAAASLVAAATSFAQSGGIISGSVLDADYGGAALNARVTLAETQQTATANVNGRFFMTNVPAGQYTMVISAPYYKASRVEEVAVADGEVTKIEIPLYNDDSDVVELESFTVKAKILENSELGLVSKRQKSSVLSDAIGSETFSRLGLSDAADVMSKVTGASIIDGKYMVVRGLSDRYNNATLNGASLPSADPNRKAVQLDQFPSGLIDAITTTKSFTPDKSGEFAGGSVDIQTRAFPDQFFYHISAGIEYNENTTGADIWTYPGGSEDWLGQDDGTRALPEIADNLGTSASEETRDQVINAFSPVVSPLRDEAPINRSFALSMGDSIQLKGDKRLGYVASLTYKRSFGHDEQDPNTRYSVLFSRARDEWVISPTYNLLKDETTDEVNVGALFNVALELSENHEIGLKNFFNQSGTDKALFQTGIVDDSESIFLRESRLHYIERSVISNQLYGKHVFSNLNSARIEWNYNKASSSQDEPDLRLFFDAVDAGDAADPRPSDWGFPTGLPNRRLFRELSEDSDEYGFDFTLPIGGDGKASRSIKFGYRSIEASRDYEEVGFGFGNDFRGDFVSYEGDRDTFLSPGNTGFNSEGVLGRVLTNASSFVPIYTGDREVVSYYLMGDYQINDKLRLTGGVRKEDTDIAVNSFNRDRELFEGGNGRIDEENWLPALNVVWNYSEKQNLRLAASRTLARPNFRELSPIPSFTNIGAFLVAGNQNLSLTEIDNFDIRWEFYPKSSELFAASFFFKDMANPIEQTFTLGGTRTWRNVSSGEVNGFEFEARKKIDLLSSEFSAVTLGGNLSLIDSKVQRTDEEIAAKEVFNPSLSPTRELQGQSELLFNFDASWEHYKKGTAVTLSYNHTGERLYEVSLAQLPNVIEEPGDSLDLIVSQRFGEKWKLKFKVGNILDSESKFSHDFLGNEFIYGLNTGGRSYSLSFSYSYR